MKTRFKQILDYYELNAKMASDKIGINPSAISHLLLGNRKPSFEVIEKIAVAFPEIDMNWFISGSGNMISTPIHENRVLEFDLSNDLESENYTKNKNRRTLKKILLFYSDGTFEEYTDPSKFF